MNTGTAKLDYLFNLWITLAVISLWTPAVAFRFGFVHLQVADLMALASIPMALYGLLALRGLARLMVLLFPLSVLLSVGFANGVFLVAAWSMLFALPFLAAMAFLLSRPATQQTLVFMFLFGAFSSTILFLSQIVLGAEKLDFRNNLNFSLPEHFGRGFALFPEVSTYAAHMAIAFCVCLTLALHRHTRPKVKFWCKILGLLFLLALMFTRSSSVIVILPMCVAIAFLMTRSLNLNTVVLVVLVALAGLVVLTVFFQLFFEDRLSTGSATRSASMRLATIIAGLSPLVSGEILGVGVGQNEEITSRAHDVAKRFDFRFGQVPTGVNSHVVARIFEEGYLALAQTIIAACFLLLSMPYARKTALSSALFSLGATAFLCALLVIGYRGIYTNWLWLAVAAGLFSAQSAQKAGS